MGGSGLSLDWQARVLDAFLAANPGWQQVEDFYDVGDESRAGVAALLAAVEAERVDAVAVADRGVLSPRAGRAFADMLRQIEDAGVAVLVAPDPLDEYVGQRPSVEGPTPTAQAGASPRVELRVTEFRKFTRLKGWSTAGQVARALRLDPATLSRVLNGRIGPGEKFIAATLAAMPEVSFTDVFAVAARDDAADVT